MSNRTDKPAVKELTTAEEVTHVAVWDKKNDLKKITKEAFDEEVSSQPTVTTDKLTPRSPGGDITFTTGMTGSSSSGGIGYEAGAGATVTQITTIVTGVTINAVCGKISTVSSTLGAGVDATFQVTNSSFEDGDVVVVHTSRYGGTADGIPICNIQAADGGSTTFDINIRNTGTVALDAVIDISFAIIKAVYA